MLIRVIKDALSSLRKAPASTAGREAGGGNAEAPDAEADVLTVGPDEDNPLVHWFAAHGGRLTEKWYHYLEIYHRHFARYRGRAPVVLEVGVFHGGSLEMWREYFGPGVRLYGVDIDPRCRAFEAPGTTILIGDQADRAFLAQLRAVVPRPDILIDDGGHTMEQQLATFEELFPHIADDGIYLCEDMHTSYIPRFGGGYRAAGSFVEYSKALIDQLYAWYSRESDQLQVDAFTRSAHAMHFYDSVLVIDRRRMKPPRVIVAGRPSF